MQSPSSFGFSALFGIGLAAVSGLVVACGGSDSESSSGDSDASVPADAASVDFSKGPLLPLTIGSRWTYKVTNGSKVTEKTLTAEATEVVGGDGPHAKDSAVKLVTDRGSELTYSWVAAEGDATVRYREQTLDSSTMAVKTETVWDPERLYVDGSAAHRVLGASWLDEYSETATDTKKATTSTTQVDERWTVTSVGESVTVPAGTFNAIVFTKAGSSKLKTYWYVPGVGKIKEEGGQTEELSDYAIAD